MASDLNVVTIVGRLTRDPELKQTSAGKSVCKFSVANNRSYAGKESVSFFNCACWGKGGEILAQYLRKGSPVGLVGRLECRTWEGSDGRKQYATEIVVHDFQFLGKNDDKKSGAPEPEVPRGEFPDEDDIPF